MPDISILIPVCNTAPFLPRCLDSVLEQPLEKIEVITVDDASTDESPAILRQYAERDARIRVIIHPQNRGLLAARASGIANATGKYILFLDSDDRLNAGILAAAFQTAEREQADIVHFAAEPDAGNAELPARYIRHVRKNLKPFPQKLTGRRIFETCFGENRFSWSVWGKLYRANLCHRAMPFLPQEYCTMAEDFCLFSMLSFFAESYVPRQETGYLYSLDSGVSSAGKTTLEKFLHRQSPFSAIRTVKSFLEKQQVWERYCALFDRQEQKLLYEYVLRWMRYLRESDRIQAFATLFQNCRNPLPLFRAFRTFFQDKDETLPQMLTGEKEKNSHARPFRKIGLVPGTEVSFTAETEIIAPEEPKISELRWQEWSRLISAQKPDAVILCADDCNPEKLVWDMLAIRDAGAEAWLLRTAPPHAELESGSLQNWLILDHVLQLADAVLTPNEAAFRWYRARGFRTVQIIDGKADLNQMRHPAGSEELRSLTAALEQYETQSARYRIEPLPDGESPVPFFRKLNALFRRLPAGFRRKLFRIYHWFGKE